MKDWAVPAQADDRVSIAQAKHWSVGCELDS